jgi:hypothetical protein
MVVMRKVELVWMGLGLVLHFFWTLICLVVGPPSPLAHVGVGV